MFKKAVNAQANRLATGGRIDRGRLLAFSFNGRKLVGYKGDTLASALLANAVSVVGRSFKYHRPRGIISSGAEEPNAIVQMGVGAEAVPNIRATQQELFYGLTAKSVNCWPSVDMDIGVINGLFSRLIPAGFYYKTFMWPPGLWMWYEKYIRKAAGLGMVPSGADPDSYDRYNAHCDVLVVGAGPTGLAAALEAARAGSRVIIADEQSEMGGSLLSSSQTIDGVLGADWVASSLHELGQMESVRLLPRTTAFGYYDHNFLGLIERRTDHLPTGSSRQIRQRVWRVRAKQVVLTTGSIERPLVFCNNDKPGIMLATAVSCYINRYAVAPGERAVVFTNNDSAYQTALDLQRAGVEVAAVLDSRGKPPVECVRAVEEHHIQVIPGHVVVQADGKDKVNRIQVSEWDGKSLIGGIHNLQTDLVAVSGGYSPVVHLHSQAGGKLSFDGEKHCFVGIPGSKGCQLAGAANAKFTLSGCLRDGIAVGATAASLAGFKTESRTSCPMVGPELGHSIEPLWLVPSSKQLSQAPKKFVDYQNDTTASDIELAVREGYESVEHVKRYTAMGFGTDQGKLGNINGAAILAGMVGKSISECGTTTFRPAYTPVTFGAIAGAEPGELFDPVRKTAIHSWHVDAGAEFENVGQWKRPWYYPLPGESMSSAVSRECRATREAVGILDASTLGKIDVRGPDAAEFLDRIYTNGWKKLKVGRARYGFMLGEDGMVMDDGVTVRLSEQHFHMTTTTGGAAHVMSWMERWLQTEWTSLQVYLTSVTDHWSTISLAGPESRNLLAKLCPGQDFDGDLFPFMSAINVPVAGVPARVCRISFSGELCYEVNVNANYGRYVWDSCISTGQAFGITPYGTEAMHVLRAEKGFVIVGQDTDGSVTPQDLGMDWICAKNKDFIGKRSLFRSDTRRDDRKQLVGLRTESPTEVLPEGAQLTQNPEGSMPIPMIGHVTSSYYSAFLGYSIALALIKSGRDKLGEIVHAPLASGRIVKAQITSPMFYDSSGERQNV